MYGAANAASRVLVEVAVDSATGARAAATGGADRIELCADLGAGGLTPSHGLLATVRAAVALPVFAMVRPRPGDFLYDADEFATMLRDVAHAKAAGADGIVTGVLGAAGSVDRGRLRELLAAAAPLPVTFHRAFDVAADADAAYATLRELGVARLLTAGQTAAAPQGMALLARLVAMAAHGGPIVMAGAGIRDGNVAELVRATGVREVHLSATRWQASAMTFRRPSVPMGTSAPDEYALRTTDAEQVARVVTALRPFDRRN